MSREWKQGDVAKFRLLRGDGRSAEKRGDGWTIGVRDNVGSWACAAAVGREANDGDIADARPLVVIDPEDREQVERLVDALDLAFDRETEYIQAALRSLNEPRPDEPQGLGAVVEDEDGKLWFRLSVENQTYPGEVWQEQYGEADRWSKWSDIKAVKVLSEGVS